MDTISRLSLLPGALLPWYHTNRRSLPWRETRQPYPIWVSEIMLQQTRVEAVKDYYIRFLEALPSIEALAGCPDDILHKLWEGLGYYSRVRNLKKAAGVILERHSGVFPGKYEDILALPGIGEYTAGAICSIAFDQPTPAVDGNVLRVISRLTDDVTPIDLPLQKRKVRELLTNIYPAEAGNFTQALMELGATVCSPNKKPECRRCPCQSFCLGFQRGTAESLPVKSPKRDKRQERRTVFLISCDGRYALEKRPEKGLLGGLWQFPNVSSWLDPAKALAHIEEAGMQPVEILRQMEKKHIFTHIVWHMRGICVEVGKPGGSYTWLTKEQINTQTALPTAFRLFWEEMENV